MSNVQQKLYTLKVATGDERRVCFYVRTVNLRDEFLSISEFEVGVTWIVDKTWCIEVKMALMAMLII